MQNLEESVEARNCRTCFFFCSRATSLACKKRAEERWDDEDEDLVRERERERFGRAQTAWVTWGHGQ